MQIQMSEWRPFAWVGLYVISSALLVRSWNILQINNNWFVVYLEIIITGFFLSIMSLYLLPKIENFPLSKISWRGTPTYKQLLEVVLITVLIVVVFVLPSFILQTNRLPLSVGLFPLDITVSNIILGGTSALAEEVVYRGFLLTYLDRTDPLEFQNNIIQAGLFTVLHFAYLGEFTFLFVISSPQLLIFTLEAFVGGLIFGWLKNRHNNLTSPTLVHVGINVIGVILR
ncbi:MAG: CPBP family intramembrane glutamic endopeptidase [Candidatus Ranarchaeia archaeon]|jgi:membrane protease YdiL (CAAX protease family)